MQGGDLSRLPYSSFRGRTLREFMSDPHAQLATVRSASAILQGFSLRICVHLRLHTPLPRSAIEVQTLAWVLTKPLNYTNIFQHFCICFGFHTTLLYIFWVLVICITTWFWAFVYFRGFELYILKVLVICIASDGSPNIDVDYIQ